VHSGVILYDETISPARKRWHTVVETFQRAGIVPGIKVDTVRRHWPVIPERKSRRLDGLRERLNEYFQMGARFANGAGDHAGYGIPSRGCIEANAGALARYAALCQEAGLVPVVEPEVLMEGDHTLQRCSELTEEVLRAVFAHLYTQRVELDA